ncbi:hypothetical protein AC481_06155 [miscellaneous Crenarchaeota group archaeon SMTZ-80]|nr:MAG: hypothetical protein AC481_06155 [miscellaneous Crenarchaeota group archaeon SMTZ-80]
MFLVLSRGKKKYHYLFALILFTAVSWDIGIFLAMIRNSYPNEIILYQTLLSFPINLFPAFVYHFTTTYLNQPRIRSTIAIYAYCILGPIGFIAGFSKPVTGVYNYGWGSIGRNAFDFFTIVWWALYNLSILASCWLLLNARKHESSSVTRRHITYIILGFIMFCLAQVKVLVAYGVDIAFFLPLGILMVSAFGALIGMAIIKDRLLDITVFVRKGIVYSILAALIIFIFDFSQHLIAKYLGDILGGDLIYIHFAIIAVVVGLFMPLKPKLEHIINNAFVKKKIKF